VKPTSSSSNSDRWSVPHSYGLIGWLALKRLFNSANNNVLPAPVPYSALVCCCCCSKPSPPIHRQDRWFVEIGKLEPTAAASVWRLLDAVSCCSQPAVPPHTNNDRGSSSGMQRVSV